MRRPFFAVALLALMAIGMEVAAQSLEGGCTVQASSDIDETAMSDATRANPFEVDPAGAISWNATSPQAIMDHTWVINIDIGGFGLPVARGGDPNTAGTLSSIESRSIPELVEQAEAAGVPNTSLLGSLRGIYRLFGNISGSGGTCFGDAYVRVEGNPLQEPIGQGAAAVAAIGLLMTVSAGVKKKG
ncbi:MAG: hypothetical protein ACRDWH_06215 [Acidimicrobiia bacterium]